MFPFQFQMKPVLSNSVKRFDKKHPKGYEKLFSLFRWGRGKARTPRSHNGIYFSIVTNWTSWRNHSALMGPFPRTVRSDRQADPFVSSLNGPLLKRRWSVFFFRKWTAIFVRRNVTVCRSFVLTHALQQNAATHNVNIQRWFKRTSFSQTQNEYLRVMQGFYENEWLETENTHWQDKCTAPRA